MKSIRNILKAEKVNMGGVILDQALPVDKLDSLDPFLLIHHWKSEFPGGQKQQDVGVGPHPHRGFSPVTFILEGSLHHRDSMNNSSIVEKGGVQWMKAGKGVTHSERPSSEIAEKGGTFEIIQVWINNAAKDKMNPPEYIPLEKDDLARIKLDDKGSELYLTSGKLNGISGPVDAEDLITGMIYMKQEGAAEISVPAGFNTLLYCLDGGIEVNGKDIASNKKLVEFTTEGTNIVVSAREESRMLLLAGKPIQEEVVTYGPFVMNTTSEVLQALKDAQSGQMGYLVEEF